ncbi:uncharacterized protein C8Q71DRAFT_688255, partial [Rhodofomes roseus]
SVRKQHHGGLLYEVNSVETMKWLMEQANMDAFVRSFGAEAQIRVRPWKLTFPNVPVMFTPCEKEYRALERENGWTDRAVMVAHWIKPLDKRKPNQRTAFLLIQFRTDEAANAAIRDGMLYMGRRIKPDRRKREVRRCLKCQHFEPAHLAAACKGEDTCGTCGSKEHKTQACYVPEGPERFCVNCNEHGHASWERECPTFIRLNRRLQSRDPLEKYKYFPIPGDPSTW